MYRAIPGHSEAQQYSRPAETKGRVMGSNLPVCHDHSKCTMQGSGSGSFIYTGYGSFRRACYTKNKQDILITEKLITSIRLLNVQIFYFKTLKIEYVSEIHK